MNTFNIGDRLDFLSSENLMRAYKLAYYTRKNKKEVQEFRKNEFENLQKILSDLKNRTYIHGIYRELIVKDSKKRYIHSPCFRDHIVHHMLHSVLYPVFDPKIPYQSFATRKGKGVHSAIQYLYNSISALDKNTDWRVCKIDVSKYFFSISHKILRESLFKHIKNPDIRYGIEMVLSSYQSGTRFDDLFPDDSSYRLTKNKGLPIGAITSQLFANYHLSPVDHHILQLLQPKIYIRYMDDIIFVDTVENIKSISGNVVVFLTEKLQLPVIQRKIQYNTLVHGFSCLGFYFQGYHQDIKLSVSRRNADKFYKYMKIWGGLLSQFHVLCSDDLYRIQSGLESRNSHFRFARTIRKLRKVIRQNWFFWLLVLLKNIFS